MSESPDRILVPATIEVRIAWAVVLTPVAGLLGVFLGFFYRALSLAPASYPAYPVPRPPLAEEITALLELALFGSFFSWPVTLVVFPFMRGRFPSRTWKAFGAFVCSGFATGFAGPLPALLMLSLLRPQNAFEWEWFFPTLGAICGFLTAMPYFLLTNPRRAREAHPAGAGRDDGI